MTATDVLDELTSLGVTATANGQNLLLEPGSKVPQELLAVVKEHKNELLDLVTQPSDSSGILPTAACSCSIPTHSQHGHPSQAGCGPTYERCEACGYTWRCKLCLGCRYCRDPG